MIIRLAVNSMNVKTWPDFPDIQAGKNVSLGRTTYFDDKRLAVFVIGDPEEELTCRNLITTCLPKSAVTGPNCAYFDTRNHPAALQWAINQGICSLIGRSAYSDYCTFPEVEFTQEAMQSMETLGSATM